MGPKEIDDFFAYLNGRDPVYTDLARLKFLSCCVTETLRLWPAVPNGTYRQLMMNDTVMGPGGTEVTLPKGARCQMSNWARHRNPDLWGPDADSFNPWREFQDSELVAVGCAGA